MVKSKKKYICACAFIFALGIIHVNPALCTKNFAGDFLTLGSGARLLGMGSASVASVGDATASYYNPASLAQLTVKEINLMHSEQFGGLENYNSVSFGAPISEKRFIGITLLQLGVGDIPYTRLWDPTKAVSDSNQVEVASREDASDYALYLSGAQHVTDKFDMGASVKVIRRSIGSDTAFGYGIDLGLRYEATEKWILGLNFRDVTGTTIAWDGKANDRIAMTMDAGAMYMDRLPIFGGTYVFTASILYFGDSPEVKGIKTMNIGAEYYLNDHIAFRAGSAQGSGTFGMGLKRLPLISSSGLDYAFLSHEELDSTHRVSLTIRF
ncbi:MAG: hypothetical protein JXB48_09865 [Candidatus Latescibacteria bacterium]|nr:hypothetical protein [Candidatus Latescibacterota bacterium]